MNVPSWSIAIAGSLWCPAVKMFTWNSDACGTPEASKGRAKIPAPSPSWGKLPQAMTKSPLSCAATAGKCLKAGGVGVDLELRGLRGSEGVEAAREDADALAVLVLAVPGDYEVAIGVHRDASPNW